MFLSAGKKYDLSRSGLVRAACPAGMTGTSENLRRDKAIKVDRNSRGRGEITALGYKPRGLVVAGAAVRNAMLEAGMVYGYMFVERGALDISASETISAAVLLENLRAAMMARMFDREPIAGQAVPVIVAVHPFDNHFVYAMQGGEFRQSYFLDPVSRSVKLTAAVVRLGKPVGACGMENTDYSVAHMPRVDNGAQYHPGLTPGNGQTYTRGAANSELMTQTVRNWGNVNRAVNNYLAAIRNGQHKPPVSTPMFSPVTITPAGKIGARLAAQGIDVFDFVKWSAREQDRMDSGAKPLRGHDLTAGGPGSGPSGSGRLPGYAGMYPGKLPDNGKRLPGYAGMYPKQPVYKGPGLSVRGGGVGSGRKPGGYNPAVNTEHPFHQTLMQHGFSHAGSGTHSHHYIGPAAQREPAKTYAGKPTQWTVGHGAVLSTRQGKPQWHDSADMNRQGNTKESLAEHLGKVGWKPQMQQSAGSAQAAAVLQGRSGQAGAGKLPARA